MQNDIIVDVDNRKRRTVGRNPRVFDKNLLNVVSIEKKTIIRAMEVH